MLSVNIGADEPLKPAPRPQGRLMLFVACALSAAVGAAVTASVLVAARPTECSSKGSAGSSVCLSLCQHVQWPSCVRACDASRTNVARPSILGEWITFEDAIQHVGVTTSNLSRSVDFYTSVMGGVEVVSAGGNGWKGNDVYQLLMQAALMRNGAAATFAANLSGPEVLDARYVAFDAMIIELLDYHSDEAQLQRALNAQQQQQRPGTRRRRATSLSSAAFPKFSPSNVAPSVAANMHISFNIRPSVSLDGFVAELETRSHAAGFENVVCNRLVPVPAGSDGEPNRSAVPLDANSYMVTSGAFEGWSLAYCKGPDGEQLEFNQVIDKAFDVFAQARLAYFDLEQNPIW